MRAALVALACITVVVILPAAAAANHRHSLQTGSGSCVVLSPQGGEPSVMLPEASFNNTTEPATTANPHPLHVHAHRGAPGEQLGIGVFGTASDPCLGGEYPNTEP